MALEKWGTRIRELQSFSPQLEQWPKSADSEDALSNVRNDIERALKFIDEATKSVDHGISTIRQLREVNGEEHLKLNDDARLLRRQLESIKAGASSVTRRVAELQEKAGQRSAIEAILKEKSNHLKSTQEKRSKLLDDLEALRDARYQERLSIAKTLNEQLGPRIKVEIERAGLHTDYVSALSAALRGSRIHYNTLAPLLAERMSPRELVEAIEKGDEESIAEFGAITADRARNLISYVRPQGLEELLTCEIEDGVRLSLLDGNDYKSTENLSTGQRCTVILPILLGRHARGLIVDQPEDHLDNAFIVETLIQALKRRTGTEQLIFSTHNANIPVLGEADRVILLGSDGKRGFVRHSGKLDSPQSIDAITTVMEGGKEAFKKRASFYKY